MYLLFRDEPGGCPPTGQAVSGMEATRAWSGCFRAEREKARPDTAAPFRVGDRETPVRLKPRGIEYRRGVRWRTGS
jgi:hypothetical protein